MEGISSFKERLEGFSFTQYCLSGWLEYVVVAILILGSIVWILSKLSDDFSWVDRLWSLLPTLFSIHILYYQHHCLGEQIYLKQKIMFGCFVIWGLRLTYNFYRKGGYALGGEDYRWLYIRQQYSTILVQILNFFFTSYYQLALLFWIASPIHFATGPLTTIDISLFLIWAILFLGQIIADEQQWAFQSRKHALLKENKDKLSLPEPYRKGFLCSGLWKYSRHPNFFCEFSMWWVIGMIGINSVGLNWSILGAFQLNLLFLGSTYLTETITSPKYPQYKQYQQSASMLIPFLKSGNIKEKSY